ncbi:MAG TPA: Mu transposase C-terminal domain-containing protein, partial [Ktedonobacteraceae bacterium]|nr:Mu transposase C-terminal domain-containing protein [Ktedonobacteraceae bacterium]
MRYQRGDVSPQFAYARNLATPIEVPYRIPYVYEGKTHEYWPDYIGTLCDGRLLIAEAGLEVRKRKGQELAKAEAARRLAQLLGGVFWIGTDKHLSDCWYQNLLFLHVRRETFRTFDKIAPVILAHWPWREERSVRDLVDQFASQWHEAEVEAAAWKIVGDAAAAGKLIVDLNEVELDLSTPLALLDPDAPPILPNPLPDSLETLTEPEDTDSIDLTDDEAEAPSGSDEGQIPGPAFDADSLPKEAQADFNRKYAAVREVLAGGVLRSVAEDYDMAPSTLSYLLKQAKEHGQIAFVSHKTYHRDRKLRPEFQELIRELYTDPMRPSVMAVQEHYRIRDKAEELTNIEGKLVEGPTYFQVWSYIASIENEPKVVYARSGLKHPPHERMSPYAFVLSIRAPALICQVDEHFIDLLVVTLDGTVITRRVHCAVLICVKTGAILAGVLAMDSLNEEDYMRLIKQAIEPKDELVQRYQCKNPWPCFGKPAVIFHDRGNIFTSERAQQATVERLKITTERAPAYCPSAKGTAEALLKWVVEKFAHRLPGTTKSNPKDRGAYQSAKEAEKAGITLDVLEEYFFQAIVDDYMRGWDKLRKQKHFILWGEAARQYGVPQWLGLQDDLKLLLMKAVNRKNPKNGRFAIHDDRISYLGRWYVSPGLLNRLRGKELDILYDRNDISVIYLYVEGLHVGEAY